MSSFLKNKFYYLLLIIPALLVFRFLLFSGTLSWGDAPHFFPEELRELISFEPFSWTSRGELLGAPDPRVYIFPILFLYGLLGNFIGNDLAIRLVFYFPAVILSAAGPALLTKYLKYSKTVQLFASLFYLLNTYFLLIVDGGQVGVALAYGLFPITLLFLVRLLKNFSHRSFFSSLIFSFLLIIFDPRVAVIAFFTVVLWALFDKKLRVGLKYLILLIMALVPLNGYWLVPLVRVSSGQLSVSLAGLQASSLLNSLTLFSPHWPDNFFGKINFPFFYFVGIPILMLLGFLGKPKKDKLPILFLFLIIAFLTKGTTPPLGGYYQFLISLPFGSAFRDSTKFFIPLVLFAGILIGKTVDAYKVKWFFAAVYIYLLLTIHPAFLGNLNFVLSDRQHSRDLQKIYENLRTNDGFFRTAWFPEVHPLTFETSDKPALSAKNLVNLRPFSNMTTGSFDRFNFIHNKGFVEWFKILGIKYLVFSGDQRVVDLSSEEQVLWDDLLARTATVSGLTKVDWETNTPIYEVSDPNPRIFAVDKLYAIVGPQPSERGSIPAVYFEDGLTNSSELEGIASQSAAIVFNQKDKSDLAMSFLKDYFIGPSEASKSQWAIFDNNDYLTFKYQLLIRGVKSTEFDYGLGGAFSTEQGEKLVFPLKVEKEGNYIVAVRKMGNENSVLNISIDGSDIQKVAVERVGSYEWYKEGVFFGKGTHELVIENVDGISIFNAVSLSPTSEFQDAEKLADVFVKHFGVVEMSDLVDREILQVDYEQISPVRYKVQTPTTANWLVFSDSYHEQWKLGQGTLGKKIASNSVPIYSMVNSFHVNPKWNNLEIVFQGQEHVRIGIWLSTITTLGLAIIFLWGYSGTRKK